MNNCFILSTPNHPLFEKLKNLGIPLFEKPPKAPTGHEVVFDLTITNLLKKEETLTSLSSQKYSIISELGPYWGDDLMKRYPAIKAAVATSFPSLQNKVEIYCPCEKSEGLLNKFLEKLGLSPMAMDEAGVGFYYPRILSLIINEAYFAKQENLASEEAIDTAMKYGVHYPQGPFEWTKKIGTFTIKLLLEELHRATKDARYHPAPALVLDAQG